MEKVNILRKATIGLIIIGIVSLIGVNLVPESIEQKLLVNSWPMALNEDSNLYVNQSFVVGFELKQGYSCDVYVSNTYDNNVSEAIVVYVRFARLSDYLDDLENDRAPVDLTELTCMRTEAQYPATADSDTYTTVSVSEESSYHLEFMGDGGGSAIWSAPGDYVVVVSVTNSGDGEVGIFDFQVGVDGQGDTIRTILTWIGYISIAAAVLAGIAYIILNRKR